MVSNRAELGIDSAEGNEAMSLDVVLMGSENLSCFNHLLSTD